jgi:enterochelin esterase family protein
VDPGNPLRAATPFGPHSVVELPGYRPPWWTYLLREPTGRERSWHVDGDSAGGVPVRLWSPSGSANQEPLPLLLVHDGFEFADLAGLLRYSAAMIQDGQLPRHRVALLRPVDRNRQYAGSSEYSRTLVGPVLDSIRRRVAVCGPLVMLGAGLGASAALLAAYRHPGVIAGILAMSGSFSGVPHDTRDDEEPFRRVAEALRPALSAPQGSAAPGTPGHLRIAMTCGVAETNAAADAWAAWTLSRAGHHVTSAQLPDAYSYTAWRDALDPHLTGLLSELWGRAPVHGPVVTAGP